MRLSLWNEGKIQPARSSRISRSTRSISASSGVIVERAVPPWRQGQTGVRSSKSIWSKGAPKISEWRIAVFRPKQTQSQQKASALATPARINAAH